MTESPKKWVQEHKSKETGLKAIKGIPTKYFNKAKRKHYEENIKNVGKAAGLLTATFSVVGIAYLVHRDKKLNK